MRAPHDELRRWSARGADRAVAGYLRRRQAIHGPTSRSSRTICATRCAALTDAGLAGDEAFLVAVKRMGASTRSRASSRASTPSGCGSSSSSRPTPADEPRRRAATEPLVACARGRGGGGHQGAGAVRSEIRVGGGEAFYCPQREPLRLAVARRLLRLEARRSGRRRAASGSRVAFAAGAVFANVYPFRTAAATPRCSPRCTCRSRSGWRVGFAYAGGRWSPSAGRMDFVRFSGELFIYYVLIALGGGVLTGFTLMMFQAIGVNAELVGRRAGCCPAARRARCSSPPGWSRRSRASSRTWRRC